MAHHLAHRVLLGVGLFALAVVAIVVVRSRALDPDRPGPRPSAAADLTVKDVALHEETVGERRWRLLADQAAVYEREGRTALRNVRAWVEQGERRWTIVGAEGDLFRDSRDVEIRRDVVVTADDGMRLETSVLRWRAADRRLWTDAPVRLVREGAVVEGVGFEFDVDREVARVTGRVRAAFQRGATR